MIEPEKVFVILKDCVRIASVEHTAFSNEEGVISKMAYTDANIVKRHDNRVLKSFISISCECCC